MHSAIEKPAIFTIVSTNYLHFARSMLQSARAHHPESRLYCVIVDRDLTDALTFADEFEVVSLAALNLPLGDEFLFQYNVVELSTAVKPWAMAHLLECGHKRIVYIDPDIYFYRSMAEVEDLFNSGADIVLTPHLTAPMDDDKTPSELDIRRSGAFNFGFCALRDSVNTRAFISWWQSKLVKNCVSDLPGGLFVDQSWGDLVPGMFQGVSILRHSGYNVAYWNIAQRRIINQNGKLKLSDGTPLTFIHYSGFDPHQPQFVSKYQNRLTLSDLGHAKSLFLEYAALLLRNGAQQWQASSYGYGQFCNGEVITDSLRKLYRTTASVRSSMGVCPFDSPHVLCEEWPHPAKMGISPTIIMMAVWKDSEDLQKIFPMTSASSIEQFYCWFFESPSIRRQFSKDIVTWHRKKFLEIGKARVVRAAGWDTTANPTALQSMRRVAFLYSQILKREPDPEGFRFYMSWCTTTSGFLRTWRQLGSSLESRELPYRTMRMLKALLLSGRLLSQCSAHPPATFAEENSNQKSPPSVHFLGLYDAESDSAENGVWASTRVFIPVALVAGELLRLEGTYFPALIAQHSGFRNGGLTLSINGATFLKQTLGTLENFLIECNVPDLPSLTEATGFSIECDGYFVPATKGLSEDNRQLSWRMKLLTIGNTRLFDCRSLGHSTALNNFVPKMIDRLPTGEAEVTKIIAFYVPQFRTPPDGTELQCIRCPGWGYKYPGSASADDHHQLQIPFELGYYDNRAPAVLQSQVKLALQYGVSAFCFVQRWNQQTTSLDLVCNQFLSDPSLTLGFCIRWDIEDRTDSPAPIPGGLRSAAKYQVSETIVFLKSLACAFRDTRYRKFNGLPLLVVSNASALADINAAIEEWRSQVREMGLPGIFLVSHDAVASDHLEMGFDAVCSFPHSSESIHSTDVIQNTFKPSKSAISSCCATGSPERYAERLHASFAMIAQVPSNERLMFIDAWNSWQTAAHLEPDRQFGYGYLHVTANVLREFAPPSNVGLIAELNADYRKANSTAILLHAFHEDLIDSMMDAHLSSHAGHADLVVTVRTDVSISTLERIKRNFNNSLFIQVPNRGRDMRPFLIAYRRIHQLGYLYACKLHTKKSPQREDGAKWRNSLVKSLLPTQDCIAAVENRFSMDNSLAAIAPLGALQEISLKHLDARNAEWLRLFLARLNPPLDDKRDNVPFPAGSMFWFRVSALSSLLDEKFVSIDDFEPEAGQLDGTLAHALERVIGILATLHDQKIEAM